MIFRITLISFLSFILLSVQALAAGSPASGTSSGPRVSAEIIAVDNIKASDSHFYYRFKLKYPDKSVSYGYIPVSKLELWYSDLNNIVGSILEFTKLDAPSQELRQNGGCSIVNPKVIY